MSDRFTAQQSACREANDEEEDGRPLTTCAANCTLATDATAALIEQLPAKSLAGLRVKALALLATSAPDGVSADKLADGNGDPDITHLLAASIFRDLLARGK